MFSKFRTWLFLENLGPSYSYGAKLGIMIGGVGGVLSVLLPPWLAWGLAGGATAAVPIPGKRQTIWTMLFRLVVTGVSSGVMALAIYTLIG